jgi:LmbE family N-acetylglucosaminyl deacetylase
MCILAHPDDETLGTGGSLAKYSSEGVECYVVCATRGERGRFGEVEPRPAPEVVGKAREAELHEAAALLGVKEVSFLDYMDADLDQADPLEAITKIVGQLRRVRPHVVLSFGPDGGYGHPDHIAISQFTGAAIVKAADADYRGDAGVNVPSEPHAVSKYYYMAWDEKDWAAYQAAFKELTSNVDGVKRQATPWPDWAITTAIDTSAHWHTVWEAVQCHKTQIAIFSKLHGLSEDQHKDLWGRQTFYRVFSTVNGGRKKESDLFEGLRF